MRSTRRLGFVLAALLTIALFGAARTNLARGQFVAEQSSGLAQEQPTTQSDEYAAFAKRVVVGEMKETTVIYRTILGSYSQHPERIAEMLALRSRLEIPEETHLWGIYANDPDLVSEDQLEWELAFFVDELAGDSLGLSKRILPRTSTISVESVVNTATRDGKYLIAWLSINGFVQTGPTMMRFAAGREGDPTDHAVTIVIPVKPRSSWENLPSRNN